MAGRQRQRPVALQAAAAQQEWITTLTTDNDHGAIARANTILRTLDGSGVHGLAIPGVSDRDEIGVFIEPAAHIIGLAGAIEQHVWRDQPEGHRSQADDSEGTIYSLRKFLTLVVAGNPNLLVPLYAPESSVYASTDLGVELRALAPAIVSQQAVRRFLGFLDSQVDQLKGEGRKHRIPVRTELIEKWGFDTKAASHAYRLGAEAVELAEDGTLTLPMRSPDREQALAIKTGGVSLEDVFAEVADLRARAAGALDAGRTLLRPSADVERVSAWAVEAHQRHWAAAA
jgi:hypothetical protein